MAIRLRPDAAKEPSIRRRSIMRRSIMPCGIPAPTLPFLHADSWCATQFGQQTAIVTRSPVEPSVNRTASGASF
jgi:hypothetical protein